MENFEHQAEQYVKSVRRAIKLDYSEVPSEWEAQLTQLRDLYHMYLKAADRARTEDPVVQINGGKTSAPNMNFNVMVQCTASMDKIIKSFGLSPMSRKKLKGSQPIDDEEDFMDGL